MDLQNAQNAIIETAKNQFNSMKLGGSIAALLKALDR